MRSDPLADARRRLLQHASRVTAIPTLTPAQYLAPQTALLWEGAEIGTLLDRMDFRSALRLKYRKHAETGEVAYNTLIGDIP